MTQEQKAKAYDEALNKIKLLYEQKPADGKELLYVSNKSYNIGYRDGKREAESKQEWSEDDERRRDGIIQWLREYQAKFNPKYDSLSIESIESLIDWLESLSQQPKPEWSKNDTAFLNEITDFFENKTIRLQHDLDMYAHWLKSLPERFNLEPKPEWSEEDEKMFEGFMHKLEVCDLLTNKEIAWAKHRLKSLRPSWKPSEEQMYSLGSVVKGAGEATEGSIAYHLKELYNQLEKLVR
jgi:hypothetical protein